MGLGAVVSKIGGMVKEALDTEGRNSSKPTSTLDSIFKKLGGGKKPPNDAGAGDLGEMDTGLASAKKGGKVKKSGYVKLHRGEKVLTRKQVKKMGPRKRA